MRINYIEDMCALHRVTPAQYEILCQLMKHITSDGYINLTTRIREDICRDRGIAAQTLSNRIQALSRNNVIEVLNRNEYRVNTELFNHGEYHKACKHDGDLVMTIRYKSNGSKEVTTCCAASS